MIYFKKVTVKTECGLCGHKEEYDVELRLEQDFGGASIFFESGQVCDKCGYDLTNEDNEIYCGFEVYVEHEDYNVNENFDEYVTPAQCEKCPHFDVCTESHKVLWPKAFDNNG